MFWWGKLFEEVDDDLESGFEFTQEFAEGVRKLREKEANIDNETALNWEERGKELAQEMEDFTRENTEAQPQTDRNEKFHHLYQQREDAIALAKKMHAGQVDKNGNDYFLCHVFPVAQLVDYSCNEICEIKFLKRQITAYLHDIIEDTNMTAEKLILLGFDEDIVEAVVAMSHVKGESYAEYVIRLKKNPISKDVKLADLKNNTDISRTDYKFDTRFKTMRRIEKYIRTYLFLTDKITEAEYINMMEEKNRN